MIIASLRGKRSKGKGRELRRETAREGEGRIGTRPFLLPHAPFVLLTRPKSYFPSLRNACHAG